MEIETGRAEFLDRWIHAGKGGECRSSRYHCAVASYQIRTFGDPVLTQRASEIEDIDSNVVGLAEAMLETMHEAAGVGLAAPQVGVQKRLFVYELNESEPIVVVNPAIVETRGEWEYEEGCLSIPGLVFPDREAQGDPHDRMGSRRQRDLHRGRRARGPLPATRARPPRRPPHAGDPRQGSAQGGHAGAAETGRGGRELVLRLAFLGSPEAAAVSLQALCDSGHDVAVVVTGRDKRRGREEAPSPTPVKRLAASLGLPVSHEVADVTSLNAELGVVVAFGRIIKPDVLARLAMVNAPLLAAAPLAWRRPSGAGDPCR